MKSLESQRLARVPKSVKARSAGNALHLAKEDPEKLAHLTEIIDEIFSTKETAFLSRREKKHLICTRFIKETGESVSKTNQLYLAAEGAIQNHVKAGDILLNVTNQLSLLAQEGFKNLHQNVYNKEGDVIGTKFDGTVFNGTIKANQALAGVLVGQQNVQLQRQRNLMDQKQHEDNLNLQIAGKDELKKFAKEALMNNPDLVRQLIEKKAKADLENKGIL
jgi:hypothetical protein